MAARGPVSGAGRWLAWLRPLSARGRVPAPARGPAGRGMGMARPRVPGSAPRSGRPAGRGCPGPPWNRAAAGGAAPGGSGIGTVAVVRLLWEDQPGLAVALAAVRSLADGVLPNLALGRPWAASIGPHPGRGAPDGLGSASGHALLIALAIGTGAYALSLLRSPAEALLEAYCSAAMQTGMQRRLARAVCAPEGIEHLENPEVLDRLASASGELSSSGPADAPMALASALGDRLSGFLACVTLATFRWWIGLLFFVGWIAIRPPLRRMLAARATLGRAATAGLRHSWFYLGCSYRPAYAKEMRLFGLGDWILTGTGLPGWPGSTAVAAA